MRANITLKSGVTIIADVEEFSTQRNSIGGELTQLNWVTSAGASNKLHYLNLADVSAIVVTYEDEEAKE